MITFNPNGEDIDRSNCTTNVNKELKPNNNTKIEISKMASTFQHLESGLPLYISDSEISKEYFFNIQSAKCRWLTAVAFIVYFAVVIAGLNYFIFVDNYQTP